MKIIGLISKAITPLLNDTFEEVRKTSGRTSAEFEILMKERGETIIDILEQQCVEILLNKYDVNEFMLQSSMASGNSSTILKLNEGFFHHFFAYVHTAHIVFSTFIDILDETAASDTSLSLKDSINITFYGNLCRMSDQIGIELKNGYPDAAMRLWRSFYEHAVIAIFLLKQNSDELAERFRDVTYKENKRSVESFVKRHDQLKFPALSKEFVDEVMEQYQQKVNQYNKDFFDNDYSWARTYLPGKPNFMAIELAAEMDRYRPFYLWASTKVHPTYKGITDFRDSSKNLILENITLQEIDRKSMIDPAQLTLSVFHDLNNFFLQQYSGHEYCINLLFFRKIYDRFAATISVES